MTSAHAGPVVIVLAAGLSTRFSAAQPGANKLLLPFPGPDPAPRTVLRATLDAVAAAAVGPSVVVTGHQQDAILQQLRGEASVFNPRYATHEMLSSLQAGLGALPEGTSAVLVMLGDLPLIRPDTLRALVARHAQGDAAAVVPAHDGRRGHPVLFGAPLFGALQALRPGQTPRDVLAAHAEKVVVLPLDDEGVICDVDTPDAYRAAIALAGRRAREQDA